MEYFYLYYLKFLRVLFYYLIICWSKFYSFTSFIDTIPLLISWDPVLFLLTLFIFVLISMFESFKKNCFMIFKYSKLFTNSTNIYLALTMIYQTTLFYKIVIQLKKNKSTVLGL